MKVVVRSAGIAATATDGGQFCSKLVLDPRPRTMYQPMFYRWLLSASLVLSLGHPQESQGEDVSGVLGATRNGLAWEGCARGYFKVQSIMHKGCCQAELFDIVEIPLIGFQLVQWLC